ncbi:MAG TPA: SPASM domain-containing protein, partial [Dehalococcoidia bacterium]|nr:SPASM domain-containing protein [Dehalococcoidia bacterium]
GVCQVRLSPQEVLQVELEDTEVCKGLEDLGQRYLGPPSSPRERLFTCGAGQNTFHIDASGRLQLCTMVREPSYDLTRGTFREGFYQFIPSLISRKRTKPSQCQVCSYRGLCQMCPGWAQLETADLEESPVPYLCQVAHLRAQAISSIEKEVNLSKGEALSCAPDTGSERG